MSEKSKRQEKDPQSDEQGKVDKEHPERDQQRLGVEDENIDDAMKKGDRGTSP